MAGPLAFNTALNGLVGQAMGAGELEMAGFWFQQSCIFLALGRGACIPSLFYVEQVLSLFGFDAPTCRLAGEFARWNAVWCIPNGWYQSMRFYMQAQKKPRPAMYNSLVFLGVNAALNWVLVFGGPFASLPPGSAAHWRGLGFVGAAISLAASRCLQALAYWAYGA
eukprot:gene361-7048_t